MNRLEKLEKYASDYYMNTAVENSKQFESLYRIIVPEIDAKFLLGLGQFGLHLTKIRPTKDGRITISMVVDYE